MNFPLERLDTLVFCAFILSWVAYAKYAKYKAKRGNTLSSVMRRHREDWMLRFMHRDMRMADAALLGNLERSASFFASTSLLIIAGILTVLTATEGTLKLLDNIPLSSPSSTQTVQFKLMLLAGIFVYAFFKFSWCLRQYNFCSILMGAAPMPDEIGMTEKKLQEYSFHMAKLNDTAGHDYNHGLRAYYFALALFSWLLNPRMLMLNTLAVVWVLYRREFHSKALITTLEGHTPPQYKVDP